MSRAHPAAVIERPGAPSATGGQAAPPAAAIYFDSHAHYYDCFDPAAFLDAAHANFTAAGARAPGHLLIASTRYGDGHARLLSLMHVGKAGHWRCTIAGDGRCALASPGDGKPALVLIPGQQLITAESLEVLAIMPAAPINDAMSLAATIDASTAADALTIVPWGFGKWWFARGRVLRSLIESTRPLGFYLGDSARRPQTSLTSAILKSGESRGLRVLAGSDPLPLPSCAREAGSYGTVIDATFDPGDPLRPIRDALARTAAQPAAFGRRTSLVRFFAAQAALRLARPPLPAGGSS